MSTHAKVCKIKTRPHPNADRLKIGSAFGFDVIVGLDTNDDDIGLYFPPDSQIGEKYALANNLLRSQNAGGYFDDNRRVRCQKFRGVESTGYWAPLSSLTSLVDTSTLKVGDDIDVLGGVEVCRKYMTPATIAAIARGKKLVVAETKMLKRHPETQTLKYAGVTPGVPCVVTLKMHGTSARTGRVLTDVEEKWYNRLSLFGYKPFPLKSEWRYVTGSRNVIFDSKPTGEKFRVDAANRFDGLLYKGEVVYYEIVGFSDGGVPIMGTVGVQDKQLRHQWGDTVTYHYGCPAGFEIYVYRIAMSNEDGYSIDLTWPQLKARCEQLGVKHVPEVYVGPFDQTIIDQHTEGPDPIGVTHPREGVCVRIDDALTRPRVYKNKSWTFGVLEGYIKDSSNYVDTEEAA